MKFMHFQNKVLYYRRFVYSLVACRSHNSTSPLLNLPNYFSSESLNKAQLFPLTFSASCSEVKFTIQMLANIKSPTS
jgi:hypothetical protein